MIECIQVGPTNCYVVPGPGGAIVVDAGAVPGRDALVDGLKAAGIRPGQVRLIFITHGHLDHYGGAEEVQAWCGAPIGAHAIAPLYSQDRRNALPPAQTLRGSLIRWFYLLLAPLTHVRPLRADVVLGESEDLAPYGVEARAISLPGHAPGSLGVVTAENDCLVGDLFVNYSVPSQPMYLSDHAAWRVSCQRVQALRPRTVYPGHGDPFPGATLAHVYPARYQLRWWVR